METVKTSGSSKIKLEAIELNGHSLKGGFAMCNIYEDLMSETWSGDVVIYESVGLQEILPIIGEEVIVIRFSSVRPDGSPHEVIQFIGRVTKYENHTERTSVQRMYKLSFVSFQVQVNAYKRVRKFYEGTSSEIAAKILRANFLRDFETLDPDKISNKIIFPNWSPYQCINYLKTISISEKYQDPFYLFWEDRDGYHFTTLSELMDRPEKEKLYMKIMDHGLADDPLTVSAFNYDPLFDTLENQMLGMYGQTLITYDKVNKKFTETEATYSGTYDQFKHVGKEKLDRGFMESPKHMFQFIMDNQSNSPGVYSNTNDWAKQNIIRSGQIRGLRAQVVTSGRTSLKVGDKLYWQQFSLKDNASSGEDKMLTGHWLITRIRHMVTEKIYEAHLELVKDGLG
jgi:hypothetical protein